MGRTGGAALEHLRLTLAVALGATGVFLVLSLATTQTPSVVMLAAAAAAVAAVVVGKHPLVVTPLSRPLVPRQRSAGQEPTPRAGRITDSPRHPLRPRAPGLV